MPQTLLLAGLIFAYSACHREAESGSFGFALFGYPAMVILVIVQTVTRNGLWPSTSQRDQTVGDPPPTPRRELFAKIPASEDECYELLSLAGGIGISPFGLAEYAVEHSDLSRDQWSLFQPDSYRRFRAEGLPQVPPCEGHTASHRPP